MGWGSGGVPPGDFDPLQDGRVGTWRGLHHRSLPAPACLISVWLCPHLARLSLRLHPHPSSLLSSSLPNCALFSLSPTASRAICFLASSDFLRVHPFSCLCLSPSWLFFIRQASPSVTTLSSPPVPLSPSSALPLPAHFSVLPLSRALGPQQPPGSRWP